MATKTNNREENGVLSVGFRATVQEAVDIMDAAGVNAITVMQGIRLVGIFTEHDLFHRVISERLDPFTTDVIDVATVMPPIATVEMSPKEILRLMKEKGCHYLPVADQEQNITGIVSKNDVMERRMTELRDANRTLTAYFSADSPGG